MTYYKTAEPVGMCSCPKCNHAPVDEDTSGDYQPAAATSDAWGDVA